MASRRLICVVALLGAVACSGGGVGSAPANTSPCAYPLGPYGSNAGNVVDPSLSWPGYVDDSTQSTTISMKDYYDCDGTRGVKALLVEEAATWCGDCVKEAQQIAPLLGGKWKTDGVHVVILMAQDQQENQATLGTALSWRNEFALTTGAVCADPAWTTRRWGAKGADNGFPTNVLIDPRTMKILAVQPADLQGTVENLAHSHD